MGVTCPACGGQSHDLEFCDHCNADLSPPAAQAPAWCPLFSDDSVPLAPEQVANLNRPQAAVVVQARGRTWRAHWIAASVWEKWRPAVEERLSHSVRVLPPCRLVKDATGVWLVAESAAQRAEPWTAHVRNDPIKDLKRLFHFLPRLAQALEELHAQQLIWLTFDPGEIEEVTGPAEVGGRMASSGVVSDTTHHSPRTIYGYLRFTNMDLRVYPVGRLPERLPVPPAYAAPEVCRFQAAELGPTANVFHLALFAYYWLAGLLPKGFAGSGLEAFGHAFPPLRAFAPALPPGIAAVLTRGLGLEPRQRYPTPSAFCAAFGNVLQRAEERWAAAAPVNWEIGRQSRTGRAKTALKRDNEDYVLVRTYAGPERALLAVADGITTCDVGSGALASLITCIMLENSFDGQSHQETFPEQITDVCRRGSESLLAWAIEKGYREQLATGLDLMGSTLLAGWLEGNTLTLANVGDSRAYLIDAGGIEQLTVDGDLGTELLVAGVAPEEVNALGGMARGLRDCVGGCAVGPDGNLKILDDFCQPTLSRWPLLPGDVVVLCSDGLVEEGAFLEPEKLGEIVRSHPHLSAEALAEQLVEAADALQRLPSPLEPEGFGDNITCIVIKVRSL